MSWKRHFRIIKTQQPQPQVAYPTEKFGAGTGTSSNFASYLPLVYAGHPNRIQRYYQFDDMDRDSDINAALDTIADFSTQSEEHLDEPFEFKYNGEPNESEVKILKTMMSKWVRLNNFTARIWYMFRDTLKNGDAFFLRDPETQEWLWLDHFMVEMVKVDDTMGKRPDEYLIRGLDYNRQTKFGSKQADPNQYRTPYGTSNVGASRISSVSASSAPAAFSLAGASSDPRQRHMLGPFSQEVAVVDAEHVVHLSLSVGNDINWPFGTSILEPIFKTFKQKELLEDAIIIYRVQRAPERRIFYIDTGTMPPERAKRHIEMIKNDIHQRRIPNRTGSGGNILDAAYNPLCLAFDTKIPLLDGRTLMLSELIEEYRNGKENWVYSCDPITGEIMPGNITWAGPTRQDADVIRITLDNGETLTCTPDHKIPVLGKGFVEAKDLTPEDSLVAFYTKGTGSKVRVYDHKNRSWIYTDRMLWQFFLHDIEKQSDELEDIVESCRVSTISQAGTLDVGTITVDGNGWHNHHTFAISSGIFVKNSINDDYFFAQSCLHTETKIHLLDGRSPTLAEIIAEHEQGKQNWVYSLDPATHELEPGKVTWAGITRRDAEMVRITLDNGEHIDVTPDHRFVLKDGSEVEAGNLQPNISLMPLYLREGRTGPRQKNAGYTRYLCNATSKTKFVHTTICPTPPGREWVVHHKDFDGKNNNPDNLQVMSWRDHEQLHKDARTYSLGRQWSDPIAREKLITGMRRLYARKMKAGFDNWRDFKQNYAINHKVVSVELLPYKGDTGDITIETASGSHWFALGAGIYVHNSDGRGSKVETLPGGEQTGEITDLMFFTRKMARGLRVPTSYINLGEGDEGQSVTFNDGKLGAAMIQEYRFTKYCMRWQSLLAPTFDKEFKRYLVKNGIEMDWGLFELRFRPPQSFTKYRQIELDSQRVQIYQGVAENRMLSKRFVLSRYLGLTEDEIIENEKLWAEENAERIKRKTGSTPAENQTSDGLSAVGVRPMGDENMPPDMEMAPDENMSPDQAGGPEGGAPGGPGAGGPLGGGMGSPGAVGPGQ